ncbi:type VI secretion protein [Phytopseudomonas dryadis]|uniref:Type VI secretion protein n=1 Tax=Phytopseudomonas dryadis TaxID=2487520 RepID=A0A4Q9R5R5_9GAMM|nr:MULTISPECIES: type VI secretion protein [Pseudomonas]TBU95703.1 type VI secretion protein [Pseudomonas dryadis]TBV06828.1 type VI secretion protein [Pseudomonas dryadis]TBV18663.1 type VI secretion protein [Pseudomonas sp. FRB 230]
MKQGRSSFFGVLIGGLGVLLLAACAWREPRIGLDEVTLDVAPRANDDTPIAVDFVAVGDGELLKLLSAIPARQWFAEREQFRRDYRHLMSIWSLELVPGQFMESGDFPLRGEAAAGLLVFAGYNTPGVHRLRLGEQRKIWLRFESRDMRLLGEGSH